MKIVTEGTSRLVFVFSDFVIKLPWLNVVRLYRAMLTDHKSGVLNDRVKEKIGRSTFISYLLIVLHILDSNRREYAFYLIHKNEVFLMPTKAFLFGHILIQPRGAVLSYRMKRWKRIYRKIKKLEIDDKDFRNPRNFSIFNEEVVMHDFGNVETQKSLVSVNFEI